MIYNISPRLNSLLETLLRKGFDEDDIVRAAACLENHPHLAESLPQTHSVHERANTFQEPSGLLSSSFNSSIGVMPSRPRLQHRQEIDKHDTIR